MSFRVKPSYDHFRVFGSLCYAHNHSRTRNKFDEHAHKCVFIGYPPGQKGWKVYDLATKQIYASRDVAFYEHVFPWAQEADNRESSSTEHAFYHQPLAQDYTMVSRPIHNDCTPLLQGRGTGSVDASSSPLETYLSLGDTSISGHGQSGTKEVGPSTVAVEGCLECTLVGALFTASSCGTGPLVHSDGPSLVNDTTPTSPGQGEIPSRQPNSRPQRNRPPPAHLQDFICHVVASQGPILSPLQDSSSDMPYSLSNFLSYNNFSASHRVLLTAITSHDEPKTFSRVASQSQ